MQPPEWSQLLCQLLGDFPGKCQQAQLQSNSKTTQEAKSPPAKPRLLQVRFFSTHKTVQKKKFKPNSRLGRSRDRSRGSSGDIPVSAAACQGLLHLWPAALGQAAPHPHGRGDTAPSKQQTLEECGTGSRSQLPCPIPAGWHAVLGAQGLFLLPAAERKGRAGKDPMRTS